MKLYTEGQCYDGHSRDSGVFIDENQQNKMCIRDRYKEGSKAGGKDFDKRLAWLRQVLDWQTEVRDTKEFMDILKIDVFSDVVFVFTPKGDVIQLPAGSVPLDLSLIHI